LVLGLRLAFAEPAGNVVAYELQVVDPRDAARSVEKNGRTSTGTASVTVRLRPTKRTRHLRVEVRATDPVGNTAQRTKTIAIR
jgi:hypothetical protein